MDNHLWHYGRRMLEQATENAYSQSLVNNGGPMYEENHILSKIEQWLDKLPYKEAEIRIEMADKTITLQKNKQRPIGFRKEENEIC